MHAQRGRFSAVCGVTFGLAMISVVCVTAPAAAQQPDGSGTCVDDAMIVFDASGSMSGNQAPGIANAPPRIDEVRSALAKVLPSATQYRRVGLVTYGPGPAEQCNVKLNFPPAQNATSRIMDMSVVRDLWTDCGLV